MAPYARSFESHIVDLETVDNLINCLCSFFLPRSGSHTPVPSRGRADGCTTCERPAGGPLVPRPPRIFHGDQARKFDSQILSLSEYPENGCAHSICPLTGVIIKCIYSSLTGCSSSMTRIRRTWTSVVSSPLKTSEMNLASTCIWI